MGTGINAAIPIILKAHKGHPLNPDYFTQGFFGNYSIEGTHNDQAYVIKQDILINNYKPFLTEFYELIEEDFTEMTNLTYNTIPKANNLDEFFKSFSGKNRNNRAPFIYDIPEMFSILGGYCEQYWLFYSGSYKAYLEEYSTLSHFEKVLAKTMKNPLAKAIKFGIFG